MVNLSLTEFAQELNDIVPVVMKEFHRHMMSEPLLGKITLPQCMILCFLFREDKSKMKDLAAFMRVTTAAMTGFIERLVRDGYVTRIADPLDRRIIKVALSAQGKDLVKRIEKQKQEITVKIFGKISVKDRHDYLRVLKQIKDILVKESA